MGGLFPRAQAGRATANNSSPWKKKSLPKLLQIPHSDLLFPELIKRLNKNSHQQEMELVGWELHA